MDLLQISQTIRKLRQEQGLTLEQLAKKSGFSKGFISQLENFRLTPSLKALNRISAALGVPLGALFAPDAGGAPEYTLGALGGGHEIFRNDNERYGMRYLALAYEQIGRRLEPFIIEYRPAEGERDFLMHDTEEFFVMLKGKVEYRISDEERVITLAPGDTIYMRANLPHKVRLAPGCIYAKALVVYAPAGEKKKAAGRKVPRP